MSDWLPSRDPKGPMHEAHAVLAKQSIQGADEGSLPASKKRFADGSRWKIEIPSVEGPQAFKVVPVSYTHLTLPTILRV